MAIYICNVCQEHKDMDHNVGAEYKDGNCCDECKELVICGTCDADVNEGGLNDNGNCLMCASKENDSE